MSIFKLIQIQIILATIFVRISSADPCPQDYTPFKDEKCYKILDANVLLNYDEAVDRCRYYGGILPVIHWQEEHEFLTEFLFKTKKNVENFWLGAKHPVAGGGFKWVDNSDLTYTNWDLKNFHNKSNYCAQIQADELTIGKWVDQPCEKKNMIVCEKPQEWSLGQLQHSLMFMRKELHYEQSRINIDLRNALVAANSEISVLNQNLASASAKVAELQKNPVPIGFTYMQLPKEKLPVEIWPGFIWTDISSTYEGVFFRVSGGQAASFGQIQEEASPRLSSAEYDSQEFHVVKGSFSKGTCTKVTTGQLYTVAGFYVGTQFCVSGDEVRPRNMAVRVWKRTG